MTIDRSDSLWPSAYVAAEQEAMEDALEAYAVERQLEAAGLTHSEAIELQEFRGPAIPGTARAI